MTDEARLAQELEIITKLVDELLGADCALDVYDGEETTVKKSTDRAAILAALRTTDDDTIRVWRKDGRKHIGDIYLVYGNSPWEVINNCSTSLDDLLEQFNAYTETASDAFYAAR